MLESVPDIGYNSKTGEYNETLYDSSRRSLLQRQSITVPGKTLNYPAQVTPLKAGRSP